MESATGAAATTVSIVEADAAPDVAEMLVLPIARLAANPLEFIVATPGTEDAQEQDWVISFVEPSV